MLSACRSRYTHLLVCRQSAKTLFTWQNVKILTTRTVTTCQALHFPSVTADSVVVDCSVKTVKGAFKVIDGEVDQNDGNYLKNIARYQVLTKKYQDALSVVQGGGGEKAIERHTKRNKKWLVWDRIKAFLDKDSEFLELSPLAGFSLKYGGTPIPSTGCINVLGTVHGRPVFILANDATVKGGTIYPIAVKKQLRGQEIAEENGIPCAYLVDSGGAFLPLQAEIFPDKENGGRAFYNQACMSAQGIHQIAVVLGSCTAGGAYIPMMSDEAVIVQRIGHVFLGGPPLVHAALGEVVSADELGGASMHCSVSGCTDYYADNEDEAFTIARDMMASLNVPALDYIRDCDKPLYSQDDLPGLVSLDKQHTIDAYKVISRLVDGSRFQEFKARFGPSLVTGFAHIEGYLVGILCNNGPMTSPAATKGAHFISLCSQRDIPLIFLQNTHPNDDTGATITDGGIIGETIKAHGKMMSAVACSQVPKITIIIGDSFGSNNFLMAGRSFSPRFLFSWPNARLSMMNPQLMTDITSQAMFPDNASGEEYDAAREKLAEKFINQSSSFYSTTRLHDDGIILPQDTRKVLGICLKFVTYRQSSQKMEPLFRM